MRRFSILCILTILTMAAASATAAPAVTFLPEGLEIEGVTSGGSIAWISIAIERGEWMNRIVPREGFLTDDDRDGRITIGLDTKPAYRSVWAIIDTASGAFTIATPEGFESPVIDPRALLGQARGLLSSMDAVEVERNELEVLFVRPGTGAWRLSATDGSPLDDDGSNNRMIRAALARMSPLGPSGSSPSRVAPGDVLIAIDPEDLGHVAIRR